MPNPLAGCTIQMSEDESPAQKLEELIEHSEEEIARAKRISWLVSLIDDEATIADW
jgi:hypothetical protein